jgi:acyl-CoA thioesterase
VPSPQQIAQACADLMWAGDRASQGLGIRIEEIGPGSARLAMDVEERMVNGLGVCHGGFLFALADSAMAFASNSYNEHALAQTGTITFLRPGRLGETLTAQAEERARAGRTGMYDVRVSGSDGTVVAEFRGHTRGIGQKFIEPEAKDAPAI